MLLEQLIHDADQQQEDEELNDDQAQDGCAHPTPLRVPLDLSVLPTTKSQFERRATSTERPYARKVNVVNSGLRLTLAVRGGREGRTR